MEDDDQRISVWHVDGIGTFLDRISFPFLFLCWFILIFEFVVVDSKLARQFVSMEEASAPRCYPFMVIHTSTTRWEPNPLVICRVFVLLF